VKWEQEFNNKFRHVSGIIKVKEIYYAKEDKTYVYHVEYDGANTYQGSKESVIEQFKNEMFENHNFLEASPNKEHIVEEIIIKSVVEKESTTTILKEDICMLKKTENYLKSCFHETPS